MRISIAMATYNGADFLAEQLDSLASQARLPHELQIGDDGSADGTLSIIEAFAQSAPFPVVLHRNRTNLGYGQNFIETAERCSGDWIAFCDQDDVWQADKLARCDRWIEQGPADLRLIVHDAELVDQDGRRLGRSLYGYRGVEVREPLAMQPAWFCAGFTQVFRADLIRSIPTSQRAEIPHPPNPDQPAIDRFPHDVWIPLLANMIGTTLVRPEPLVRYRRHGATLSNVPPRAPIAARIRDAIDNHGERYTQLADWCGQTAEVLERHAAGVGEPAIARRLEDGIAALRDYASNLRERSIIHGRAGRPRKLASLRRSWNAGAYRGARWAFGLKSFLKDAVSAVW